MCVETTDETCCRVSPRLIGSVKLLSASCYSPHNTKCSSFQELTVMLLLMMMLL